MKKTILTGLRVNSELHLGHYLGVLLPMVRLANKYSEEYNVNIFVPDLHSIISPIEGSLKENMIRSMKYFLAAGLKINENVHIYRQSHVPAYAELAWVLNCHASMGEVSRMIQYKEKGEGKDSANVGIFDYPILMAADILLYDANYVPVGEDQFQHIELTRNLATRFNNKYGEVFTIPCPEKEQAEFMGENGGVRIRDLVNPEKKMSKSTPGENSKIMLSDEPKKAGKKIKSATTDSFSEVDFDFRTRPGISNLLQILALVKDKEVKEVAKEWRGKTSYGELKSEVADAVENLLEGFQTKLSEISDEEVLALFPEGEKYANEVANKKLDKVYKIIGLR